MAIRVQVEAFDPGAEVNAMLDSAYASGEKTGYVANLGHGITQWVNPDNAKVFIDAVHDYKI